MRLLSKNEKRLLKKLIKSDSSTFGLIDFLSDNWPGGKIEVSTFQQTLSLQVTDDELPGVMNHLVDRLNFVKVLEREGYINLWSEIPSRDNTASCGVAASDAKTIFVPDIGIATELLKYANYKISFNHSLIEWSRKNFRNRGSLNLLKGSVYVLILLLIADLVYHAQGIQKSINLDHQKIVANSEEVLKNQYLSNQIIDSLRSQNQDLMVLTDEITSNTRNLKGVLLLVKQNQNTMNSFQSKLNLLNEQLGENRKSLLKADSLLEHLANKGS